MKMSMFRFTIREILLLTVITGIAVAWWIDRTELDRQRNDVWYAYISFINQAGGHVSFDCDDPATVAWLEEHGDRAITGTPRILIQEGEEAKLGLDIEP